MIYYFNVQGKESTGLGARVPTVIFKVSWAGTGTAKIADTDAISSFEMVSNFCLTLLSYGSSIKILVISLLKCYKISSFCIR